MSDADLLDLVPLLHHTAAVLAAVRDESMLVAAMDDVMGRIVDAEYVGLFFLDRATGRLRHAFARGFSEDERRAAERTAMERHIGEVFRTRELLTRNQFEVELPPALLDILLQTFADLRDAQAAATSDDQRLESSLSTAEQIGVLEDAVLHSQFFGQTSLSAGNLAKALVGTLVRRIPEEVSIMNKFWHSVIDKRAKDKKGEWDEYLEGGKLAMSLLK